MRILFRPWGDIFTGPTLRGEKDRALVARLSQRIGAAISENPDVDYEDWMEPATLLLAALDEGLETVVLGSGPLAQALEAPVARIDGRLCPNVMLGRLMKSDPHSPIMGGLAWPRAARDDLANRYGELASVLSRMGRRAILADMPGEAGIAIDAPIGDGPVSVPAGEALARLAGSTAFVKQTRPAKAMTPFSLAIPPGATADDCERSLFEALDYHIIRFEGMRAALLVQDAIDMRHEMRFYVIDGRVVTGAGCVECSTPAQNQGVNVDPVTEDRRNRSTPTTHKAVAQRLATFAQSAADAIAEETARSAFGSLEAYTLDIALDGATGEPVIVEMNPAANAGLYATNAPALVKAIMALAARRQPTPRPVVAENFLSEGFLSSRCADEEFVDA